MKYDFVIVGAGIVGLTIAYTLEKKYPNKKILIIEKEKDVAFHSSGRNSGILHAGFYYMENSLKARFCRSGNLLLREFFKENDLNFLNSRKVVVAKDKAEHDFLLELYNRGIKNNVDITLIDKEELADINPNILTFEKAIYSPTTASFNPKDVCLKFKEILLKSEVELKFNTSFRKKFSEDSFVTQNDAVIEYKTLINTAGLQADRLASEYIDVSDMVILPFKGTYLTSNDPQNTKLEINIYPTPDPNMPFLGVHLTVTSSGKLKIGPTAIPVFGRENYSLLKGISFKDTLSIGKHLSSFLLNNPGYKKYTLNEIKKLNKSFLFNSAKHLYKDLNKDDFNTFSTPGIRAQLYDKKSNKLINDFIIRTSNNTVHILNAVSPAFTSSLAFSDWVVNEYL